MASIGNVNYIARLCQSVPPRISGSRKTDPPLLAGPFNHRFFLRLENSWLDRHQPTRTRGVGLRSADRWNRRRYLRRRHSWRGALRRNRRLAAGGAGIASGAGGGISLRIGCPRLHRHHAIHFRRARLQSKLPTTAQSAVHFD